MSQIPLNALRTFEAVASRLSFTKGAQALNVSPAAVSSQIRALEERLNQPLFQRSGKVISLTEAGRKLLPGVQRGLSELRQAMRTLDQDLSDGVLNVSVVPTFLQKWIMPRLADFYRTESGIDLRINADSALVNFGESDFHAAIRFGAGSWPGLKATRLLDDWILPVCSPDLLKKIGPISSMDELQRHDLLFVDSEIWSAWFKALGESGRKRRWPLLNDSLSILMAAEQGQGIALSRWSLAARDIAAGRLVRPIPMVVKTDWSYYFVSPPHYFDIPKVFRFRKWMEDSCSQFEKPRPSHSRTKA
jgi:LysR family transcriptional regulator, glycine cleavage system transcriptional activator